MSWPFWSAARGSGTLGPVASRDRICGVTLTFQGLTVDTRQFGRLPWFDPAIMCLDDPADRQSVYAAKRAMGDTHLIIECSSTENPVYHLGPYADLPIIIKNCELDLAGFRGRVLEVLAAGFVPMVAFDGDDGDNQYGHPNAMRQLPMLVDLLKDLNNRILYARLWDGVFYGSSPEHIAEFGRAFRQLLPNGYLAIEHSTGHIPIGGGQGDWAIDGPMSTYDVLLSEYDLSNTFPQDEGLYEVALRLLGPDWVRPDGAPSDYTTAYAISKWYLRDGTPRGPYFTCAMEWVGAMDWVQGRSTALQEAGRRQYFKSLGYRYTG